MLFQYRYQVFLINRINFIEIKLLLILNELKQHSR